MTTQAISSSTAPVGTQQQNSLWRAMWKHRTDYILISPFFIIFAIFHGFPLIWSVWLSLQKWQGIGEPKWFGIGNYERLLNTVRICGALGISPIFLFIIIPIIY